MGKLSWKLLGGLSAVVAGIAGRKVLETGWRAVVGDAPPTNPESPDTTWQEAVGWALLSGVVVGLARLLAARKAAEMYRRSTGHLPPGLENVAA